MENQKDIQELKVSCPKCKNFQKGTFNQLEAAFLSLFDLFCDRCDLPVRVEFIN